ncbi:MAG: hypothetical protein KDB14_17510 [Planctomycetales bacterium]|nr:hypothetical protein [Planctomycetales bacterium]
MSRFIGSKLFRWAGLLVVGTMVTACVTESVSAQSATDGALQRGMKLFLHTWQADDPEANGDGLGPLHNDTSCLNCHFLRTPGGAGRLESNIQLITAIPRAEDSDESRRQASDLLVRLHPAFGIVNGDQQVVRRSIVLHRRDVNPAYAAFRATLLGQSPSNFPVLEVGEVESHLRVLVNAQQMAWIVSERNSPALFGVGLIDRLPDSVFFNVAAGQTGRDNIKGRVARTAEGRIGRFGWRGQSASLESFVATAFAVELGLSNEIVAQDPSPLAQLPQGPPPHDVTLRDIRDVTAFLAALPEPSLELRGSATEQKLALRGRGVFTSIGCAICHVQDLGEAKGIYSDLLLHDMGDALADPVPGAAVLTEARSVGVALNGPPLPPAPIPLNRGDTPPPSAPALPPAIVPGLAPSVVPVPSGPAPVPASPPGASTYAGGGVDVFATVDPLALRLWRTPPLWGVGDSSPYLHDGRAGTLRRAIILHSGEGEAARNRFLGLSEDSQDALLLFLASLRAPQLISEAPSNE